MRKHGNASSARLLVAAALLLSAILPMLCPPAGANITITIATLGNGQPEGLVSFSSAGTRTSLNLSVQTGLRASSAFLSISGSTYTSGGKDGPESPSLDLGDDGDIEWRYNGTGFGALGFQYMFASGNTSARITYLPGGGNDTNLSLRFPAGAVLADCYIDLLVEDFTGEAVDASIDVGADTLPDWSGTGLALPVQVTGLSSVLTAYISSAQPAGTDSFGVKYVDVPLRIECNDTANLTLQNLTFPYGCKVRTNDLSAELNSHIPAAPGTALESITLALSTLSPGKLKVSDVQIVAAPPVHAPTLYNPLPPEDVVMDENSAYLFRISQSDSYGNPVTLQWYVDDAAITGANGTSYILNTNYNSSGQHVVEVRANNTLDVGSWVWNVTVRNVNRLPVVTGYYPKGTPSVAENSSLDFNATAYDPDGKTLSYLWTLDGSPQMVTVNSFRFSPIFGQSGAHELAVSVVDGDGGATNITWSITVRRTNVAPEIVLFSPKTAPSMKELETIAFSVTATDMNGDSLTYTWAVDGNQSGEGRFFNYTAGYFSGGLHNVKVFVSDGEYTVERTWTVTVEDVNRFPTATLDRPREGDEFVYPAAITFSGTLSSDLDGDPLTFKWYDGDVEMGSVSTLQKALPKGKHAVRLVVGDGKGASSEARVNFTVREIVLSATLNVAGNPKTGDAVTVTVTITNSGDTAAMDYPVRFFVDGDQKAQKTIPRIDAGKSVKEKFTWTAETGKHVLTTSIGDANATKSLSVAAGTPDWLPVLIIVIILAVVITAVAGFLFMRTKKLSRDAAREKHREHGSAPERRPGRDVPVSPPAPPIAVKPATGKPLKGDDETPESDSPYEDASLLDQIILDETPYKEAGLKIKTTIQRRVKPEESVRDELSMKTSSKRPVSPELTVSVRDESAKPAPGATAAKTPAPAPARKERTEVVSLAPTSAAQLFTGVQTEPAEGTAPSGTEDDEEAGEDDTEDASSSVEEGEDAGEMPSTEPEPAPSALMFAKEEPSSASVLFAKPAAPPVAPRPAAPPVEMQPHEPEVEEKSPAPVVVQKHRAPAIETKPAPPPVEARPAVPGTGQTVATGLKSDAPPAASAPMTIEARLGAFEQKMLAAEMKGADIAAVRRSLGLGRSFQRGGIPLKAEQYMKKAEEQLSEAERWASGKPGKCLSCGAVTEPGWVECPECGKPLKG